VTIEKFMFRYLVEEGGHTGAPLRLATRDAAGGERLGACARDRDATEAGDGLRGGTAVVARG